MNTSLIYKMIAKVYDLLDVVYFKDYEHSPRKVVLDRIAGEDKILDLCTGTATNAINIAAKNPGAKVVGVDLSKQMLNVGRGKVKKEGLRNIRLYQMDATELKFKSHCFDKVLISLVLHEMEEDLAGSLLAEAGRVLKDDGEIIVTEWEPSKNPGRKILFAPIHFMEPKPYKTFIHKDMDYYFGKYGFNVEEYYHTDYTKVLVLRKMSRSAGQCYCEKNGAGQMEQYGNVPGSALSGKRISKVSWGNMPELSCENKMSRYLEETPMLDYGCESIQRLIRERGWKDLSEFERLKSIYNYVRDEILFGYNVDDDIPASKVLKDGYGQCNTKGTLFMALLRGCGIPCRIHGFTIDKKLQKGAMTGFVYRNAPESIFHSWVEVLFEGTWYELEAFILDTKYLKKLQAANPDCEGSFCGYGVAVKDFRHPVTDFNRNNTYIQSEGINQDFGIYDNPDELLLEHGQEIGWIKKLAFRHYGRHRMNRNVKKIRELNV